MKYRVCSPATGSALACGANNAKIATGANISQRDPRTYSSIGSKGITGKTGGTNLSSSEL